MLTEEETLELVRICERLHAHVRELKEEVGALLCEKLAASGPLRPGEVDKALREARLEVELAEERFARRAAERRLGDLISRYRACRHTGCNGGPCLLEP